MIPPAAFIRAENVSVRYDGRDKAAALRGLSFSVAEGERIALVGANGAGKSTLLLALVGVLPLAAGTLSVCGIELDGTNKENLRELRRRAALVFQNPDDQVFMPTVEEDIAFGPRNYGASEEHIAAVTEKVLAELGIGHLRGRLSHRLSGGEKRLAALAGILVMEPSLLLLDEPSSFLDPRSRRRLIDILGRLTHTMLLATHDLDLARALCRRVILLKDGSVFADGMAAEVLDNEALLETCGL
ncbi:MAG: energy-coupling factor ABC transporter ATP-binding protein [Treponema sp.]|nr:energy-coupling factor ABC transporter ATP-binding protein [Treponema sp.]